MQKSSSHALENDNHYCQNDIKSSLLLPIMCERTKNQVCQKCSFLHTKRHRSKSQKVCEKHWSSFHLLPCISTSNLAILKVNFFYWNKGVTQYHNIHCTKFEIIMIVVSAIAMKVLRKPLNLPQNSV
jgi:hypothetical protein